MSWKITGPERRVCPVEFQRAIDDRFGFNRFGTPNFRIVWGQTETTTVAGTHGYEQRIMCHNMPCWNILRWRAPEAFGTPELYYIVNRDPETGLCILGEYPWEGRYDILQPLMAKEFMNGRLVIDAFPLSYQILDTILPLFLKAQEMTQIELDAANAYAEAEENRVMVSEIADRLMDDLPTRFGPVSYGKHGCRTALIDRKMAEISKVWDRMSKTELRKQRQGFFTH